MYTYTRIIYLHAYTVLHTHIYTSVCIGIIDIYVYVCVNVCIYMNPYTCIYIRMCIHVHVHSYIYISVSLCGGFAALITDKTVYENPVRSFLPTSQSFSRPFIIVYAFRRRLGNSFNCWMFVVPLCRGGEVGGVGAGGIQTETLGKSH